VTAEPRAVCHRDTKPSESEGPSLPSPVTAVMVRCRHPERCSAEQLVPSGLDDIVAQLSGIGWTQHHQYGWICPPHVNQSSPDGPLKSRTVFTHRTQTLIQAIRDGHNFGMAIMRQTGLSESTVYATLRRLHAAGWTECEVEPVELAVRRQRPRRKIYRLTERLLDELGWPH
jgi:hypothetical protein